MLSLPHSGIRATTLAAFVGVAVAALASCSLVYDTEQVQCETAMDCSARGLPGACMNHVCVEAQDTSGQGGGGGAEATPWGCLDNVKWPEPEPGVMVTVRARLRMASAGEPIPADLVVHFCSVLDVTCAVPIAGPLAVGADGVVAVQVESGTRGYFQLGGPSIIPSLLYLPRPAQATPQPVEQEAITLITPSLYQSLLAATGFMDNSMRGTLLTVTLDCLGKASTGVRILSPQTDTGATPFYFVGLIPSPGAMQTDTSGYAGVLFLPLGPGTVESYIAADNRRIGVSGFHIRAGTLTNVAIEPTPAQ
jgi:hypothetical protein